ncbi:glycosyltransferase [soil metagenome]
MKLPAAPEAPRASIIIRAFNESHHLAGVLSRVARQSIRDFEVILVDSGSTDNSVEIARRAGARIVKIDKSEFTFGRSLNHGCEAARGEALVFLSGHCYPMNSRWLESLLAPFDDQSIGLVYGKQRGGRTTKFSEHSHFAKSFPGRSAIPQKGFFCNNANCAIRTSLWRQRPFDETLTGLEDLDWAKWLVSRGGRVGYQSRAGVIHVHDESWPQVFRRYEREAIALRHIIPDLRLSLPDFLRHFMHSTMLDAKRAGRGGLTPSLLHQIVAFRFMQYWGSYRGAHFHRPLTQEIKEKFFYPHK